MRTLLIASAAVLLMGGTALAQNAPANPRSAAASNITGGDTHSKLAPQLPTPGGTGSGEDYLQRAARALRAHQTGTAQEALERAETRFLDRATAPDMANQPVMGPRIDAIRNARKALAAHDTRGAMQYTQQAMQVGGGGSDMGMGSGAMGSGSMGSGSMGSGSMGMTGVRSTPANGQANGAGMGADMTGNGMQAVPTPGAAGTGQPQINMNPSSGSGGNGTGPAQ